MSGSNLYGWLCPRCRKRNYYHQTRCHHCTFKRELSKDVAFADGLPPLKNGLVRHRLNQSGIHQYKRIIFLSLTGMALIAWLYLIWDYRKWDARWGSINVLVPTLLAAVVLGWWISRRNWFRDLDKPTRWRFMIVPVVGFILCAWAGIYFTEPIEVGGSVTLSSSRVNNGGTASSVGRRSPDYQYDYSSTRASNIYLSSYIFDFGEGAADVGGDVDEGCLLFLLVILVIVLIIGSFMIPHFWALSTFVLLVTMAMFTYREWRLLGRPIEFSPSQM